MTEDKEINQQKKKFTRERGGGAEAVYAGGDDYKGGKDKKVG